MARDTRNRILVNSLLLFNEQGEPKTTINDIADETDISPGNLHYHFRKKADIVNALMAEFQADARNVLAPPEDAEVTLDEFWMFLHLLLEFTAAYRFLFRDLETLGEAYPKVASVMGHFATGLSATFELYLRRLSAIGVLELRQGEAPLVARNLAVIALFSERFTQLTGAGASVDDEALQVASSILSAMRPFAASESVRQLDELASRYRP